MQPPVAGAPRVRQAKGRLRRSRGAAPVQGLGHGVGPGPEQRGHRNPGQGLPPQEARDAGRPRFQCAVAPHHDEVGPRLPAGGRVPGKARTKGLFLPQGLRHALQQGVHVMHQQAQLVPFVALRGGQAAPGAGLQGVKLAAQGGDGGDDHPVHRQGQPPGQDGQDAQRPGAEQARGVRVLPPGLVGVGVEHQFADDGVGGEGALQGPGKEGGAGPRVARLREHAVAGANPRGPHRGRAEEAPHHLVGQGPVVGEARGAGRRRHHVQQGLQGLLLPGPLPAPGQGPPAVPQGEEAQHQGDPRHLQGHPHHDAVPEPHGSTFPSSTSTAFTRRSTWPCSTKPTAPRLAPTTRRVSSAFPACRGGWAWPEK